MMARNDGSEFSLSQEHEEEHQAPRSPQPLMTLTYRSRAAEAMTLEGLQHLRDVSAARNRMEGVTGVVLYDNQRFFQWLEGPPDSVARVWSSISRDPRHTDIEAISVHAAPTRLFGQWDMRLATSRGELHDLPGMPPGLIHPEAERLATLAIGPDADAVRGLIAEAYHRSESLRTITEQLIEPAARRLSDLWSAGDCSEYEVTLGLCRIQTSMRVLMADRIPEAANDPLVVLVAPLPGEIHLLGATLGAEATWQAGWDTDLRFPSSEEALKRIVATNWFDAIDLSLSPASQREHRIRNMEKIIQTVRRASKNPDLVVVAGGRAFYDRLATSSDVGADASHASASQVTQAIEQARRRGPSQ